MGVGRLISVCMNEAVTCTLLLMSLVPVRTAAVEIDSVLDVSVGCGGEGEGGGGK